MIAGSKDLRRKPERTAPSPVCEAWIDYERSMKIYIDSGKNAEVTAGYPIPAKHKAKNMTDRPILKYKPYNEYKDSEDRAERTAYFIYQLSPHNLWKGVEAINELLKQQRAELERYKVKQKREWYMRGYKDAEEKIRALTSEQEK